MHHSLTIRLTVAMSLLLIFFMLLTSFLVNLLMREKTVSQYSRFLQRDAYAISQNLHDLLSPEGHDTLDETRLDISWDMLAPYLSLTEQITRSNVYLVDSGHNITGSFDGVVQTLDSVLLPAYLEQSIALGFIGKTPFIRSGNGPGTRLTACAPIMDKNSRVLGVVLLDTTLRELGYTQVSGTTVLIYSAVISFVVALGLAYVLLRVVTKPIEMASRAALELSCGNYDMRLSFKHGGEVGQLASSVNILAERLQESRTRDAQLKKRQQQFFSTVSHELRTPVTVLRGSIESLADGIVSEPDDVNKTYQQMLAETTSLQKLINDLLELSRLQDPEFAIEMEPFSLADLLGDVAMSTSTLCAEKGVQFTCCPPENDVQIMGDYQRLRQMLLAIADNAVKFTAPGKCVSLLIDDSLHIVTISDQGIGMTEEEREHAFERFYHTRKHNSDGSGLGLAIVKGIAQRHGIPVSVSGAPGEGTAFSFDFSPIVRK